MTDGVYTTDEIRRMVLPLLGRYDISQARLFGSYARGAADAESDIDVLLIGAEGFRPLNIFGVAEDLHRASGKRVDVYEISELDEGPFREKVLEEAVVLLDELEPFIRQVEGLIEDSGQDAKDCGALPKASSPLFD